MPDLYFICMSCKHRFYHWTENCPNCGVDLISKDMKTKTRNRVELTTNKRGLLGIFLGTLLTSVSFLLAPLSASIAGNLFWMGFVLGGFITGFMGKNTFNGVMATILGIMAAVIVSMILPKAASIDMSLLFKLIVFCAFIGIIFSYIGRTGR